MPRRMTRLLSFGLLALGTFAGCSVAPSPPPRSANSQPEPQPQIDDEEIRKAFEARPQMPASAIRLSYYTFDPEIAVDLDKTLSTMPGVSSVYRIPPLLVTGQQRYQENEGHSQRTSDVSLKKLRLLAARAKTDVLVIVDHGIQNGGVNPLIGLTVLLVPVLFVPFIDAFVKGYVETFVIDVRNGCLYGHLVQEDERGNEYATIYSKKADAYAAEQWKVLRTQFGIDLAALIEKERTRKEPSELLPPAPPAAATGTGTTP